MINIELFHLSHTKPTVVLLHGLFGDKNNLSALRRSLAGIVNVVTADLPNHGQSGSIARWDLAAVAAQLKVTLQRGQLEPDAIIGHSLGGKVAMAYALAFPEEVKAIVVADMAPVANPPRHYEIFNALNAVKLTAIKSRQEVHMVFNEHHIENGIQQFLLKSLKQINGKWNWQFDLKSLQDGYEAICGWPFEDEQSSVPVFFIKGEKSDYITAEHTHAVQKHFTNAQIKMIGGAGHWLHAEKPMIFNRLVAQFLQQTIL